jgi:hypothetical protein
MNTLPQSNQVERTKKNPVPLVVKNVDVLKDFNIMPLIYPGGASGEFLASALVQTMPRMTLTRHTWYHDKKNRANFYDAFNKLLNGGYNIIDNEEIINEVNMFFYVNGNHIKDFNVALVHPNPVGRIEWLSKYLPSAHALEITTKRFVSQKFRTLAANAKINYPGRVPITPMESRWYHTSGFTGPNHLQVEWEDFLIKDVEGQFHRMEEFFGNTGDLVLYKELVTDYRARNQSLIDQSV